MRAGILDDVKERGFHPKSVAWRKLDETFIAGVTNEHLPEDYPYKLVVLPLDRLGVLLYEHIQRLPTATVKWSHRVVKVGQDKDKAWVEVETPTGRQRREAEYVVGCDGASSTVRKELFGPEYPGETLNAQIIATNVSSQARNTHGPSSIHPDTIYTCTRNNTQPVLRYITTLPSTASGTRTSSCTQRTGTWPQRSPRTVSTESRTATSPD